MSAGALSRFKVVDLTRVRAGPTCVRQLADHGADVVKVEAPGSGDSGMGGPRHGPDFQNLHRNKRCITLDLKAPDGLEVLRRLGELRELGRPLYVSLSRKDLLGAVLGGSWRQRVEPAGREWATAAATALAVAQGADILRLHDRSALQAMRMAEQVVA